MSSNSSLSPNVMIQAFPKVGKEARMEELILQATEGVRLNEPWISLYRHYRVKKDVSAVKGEGDMYVICRESEYITVFHIDDISRLGARADLPHLQAIGKAYIEEDLLREPLKYSILEDMDSWKC